LLQRALDSVLRQHRRRQLRLQLLPELLFQRVDGFMCILRQYPALRHLPLKTTRQRRSEP
jgi:hypothetical protein